MKGYLTHGHALLPKVNFAYWRSVWKIIQIKKKKKKSVLSNDIFEWAFQQDTEMPRHLPGLSTFS